MAHPASCPRCTCLGRVWIDAVVASKDAAIRERELVERENVALRTALAELVRLKDGPRNDAYRAAKDAAWEAGRKALRGKG